MRKTRAFTLIELLVVIAVIAVLMAILMPSLNRARNQAQSVACKTHLKQMYLAVQMYTDEHDGKFHSEIPGNGAFEGAEDYKNSWVWALRPYYSKQPEIRNCPAVKKFQSDYDGGFRGGPFTGWGIYGEGSMLNVPGWAVAGDYGSFGWNWWLCDEKGGQSSNPLFWRNKYKIKQASRVPVFVDAQWVDGKPQPDDPPLRDEFFRLVERNMGSFCINRHNGFVNGCFADGTVRSIGIKELWEIHWHTQWREERRKVRITPDFWPEWMTRFTDYSND